ncbi:DNA mismatch repair protein MutS, partial [Streptococcus suis]
QMEDPKKAVGVVKREVVQVVTPGTVMDSTKSDRANNFLVAIDCDEQQFGLSYMDVSTGEFWVTELSDFGLVRSEIMNLKARELVVGYDLTEDERTIFTKQMNLLLSSETEQYTSPLIPSQLTPLEKK